MQFNASQIQARATKAQFKATIRFPSRAMAQTMGKAWTRKTLIGHSISPSNADGSASVTLYQATEDDKEWIENTAHNIAAQ